MRSIMEERKKRLRGLSMKLTSADLNELEKEPAYKRRNVDLDDVPHSSESNVSKYSLYEEEKNKPEIKQKRNPFLHDNVD
jgi:cell division protein FtsZ